jgi:hypothetical protein
MAAASNYNAVLARLEYAIDSLHARGHQIDRSAAARALSYFSARASGAEYNEQAWRAAVEFMIEQGLCFEWVINGNMSSMIEMSASHFQERPSIDSWDKPASVLLTGKAARFAGRPFVSGRRRLFLPNTNREKCALAALCRGVEL